MQQGIYRKAPNGQMSPEARECFRDIEVCLLAMDAKLDRIIVELDHERDRTRRLYLWLERLLWGAVTGGAMLAANLVTGGHFAF